MAEDVGLLLAAIAKLEERLSAKMDDNFNRMKEEMRSEVTEMEARIVEKIDGHRREVESSEIEDDEDDSNVTHNEVNGWTWGKPSTKALFPLTSLNLTLLEKVITKLESTAYFRLQQTCRGMYELIRKSRNISVHLAKHLNFTGGDIPQFVIYRHYNPVFIDIEDLHGIRVTSLYIKSLPVDFMIAYNLLKKLHFSCVKLELFRNTLSKEQSDGNRLSKEQCLMLMKLLVCQSVHIIANDVDQAAAVFESIHLKSVRIDCPIPVAECMIPRLLSTFPEVDLVHDNVPPDDRGPENYTYFSTILKMLSNQSFPNVQKFDVYVIGRNVYCQYGISKMLTRLNLPIHRVWRKDDRNYIIAKMPRGDWVQFDFGDGEMGLQMEYRKDFPSLDHDLYCNACSESEEDD